MAKEVKIVTIALNTEGEVSSSQRALTNLVNDGWVIVSSGGGSVLYESQITYFGGFVILQRG